VPDGKISIATQKLDVQRSLVHLRWSDTKGCPAAGMARIEGAEKIFTHPVGFEMLNFGGDLFTDDGNGVIQWHCMRAPEIKGLDITIIHGPQTCVVSPCSKVKAKGVA
jgi:hypothetical protein